MCRRKAKEEKGRACAFSTKGLGSAPWDQAGIHQHSHDHMGPLGPTLLGTMDPFWMPCLRPLPGPR